MSPFEYHDDTAFHPLKEETLDRLAGEARKAAGELLETEEPGERAILRTPGIVEDVAPLRSMMEALLSGASDLVFLGVGGSSLGAQALAQTDGWGTRAYLLNRPGLRLHFLDNLDARTGNELFNGLDAEGARFFVVSKSGNTLETLAQSLVAVESLRSRGVDGLHKRFAFLTEPGDNSLRRLAEHLDAPVFDHDPLLGGRFSVLGALGAATLLAMGKEVAPMREGAAWVLEATRSDMKDGMPLSSPLRGALAAAGLSRAGYDNAVLLAYGDRFEAASKWHQQLWMESLGKQGHGANLNYALAPVAQHAQLQAWLDAGAGNWFTLLCPPPEASEPIQSKIVKNLQGHSLSCIIGAQWRATAEVLVEKGAPLRRFRLNAIDAYGLGGLFMHFMIETLVSARMLGIDALGQPAVEQVKRNTIERLGRG